MRQLNIAARLVAAGILLQTLFFKFTAAPESVFIFTQVGVEPWGRIASGVFELIAAVLILMPVTQVLGALLAAGIMFGAIASHLLILGLVVQNDGGLLFGLALVVFCCSLFVVYQNRKELIQMIKKFQKAGP